MELMQHTRTEDLRFVLWREMQIRPEVRGSTSIEIDLHAFPHQDRTYGEAQPQHRHGPGRGKRLSLQDANKCNAKVG